MSSSYYTEQLIQYRNILIQTTYINAPLDATRFEGNCVKVNYTQCFPMAWKFYIEIINYVQEDEYVMYTMFNWKFRVDLRKTASCS